MRRILCQSASEARSGGRAESGARGARALGSSVPGRPFRERLGADFGGSRTAPALRSDGPDRDPGSRLAQNQARAWAIRPPAERWLRENALSTSGSRCWSGRHDGSAFVSLDEHSALRNPRTDFGGKTVNQRGGPTRLVNSDLEVLVNAKLEGRWASTATVDPWGEPPSRVRVAPGSAPIVGLSPATANLRDHSRGAAPCSPTFVRGLWRSISS